MRSFSTLLLLATLFAPATQAFNLVVSVAPQKYVVDALFPEATQVQVMVKPEHNPESYRPSVKQMLALENATLYSAISVPFETIWMDKMKSINNAMQVTTFTPTVIENDHHIWTDPLLLIEYTEDIARVLKDKYPLFATKIEQRKLILIQHLMALDWRIKVRFKDLKNKHFVVFHSAFYHFAKRYNLTQLSMVTHEESISGKKLAELSTAIKNKDIKLMIIQKQHNQQLAIAFAKRLNLSVVEIDLLSENPIEMLDNLSLKIQRENQ